VQWDEGWAMTQLKQGQKLQRHPHAHRVGNCLSGLFYFPQLLDLTTLWTSV